MSHKFGEGYFDLGDSTIGYDELVVLAGERVLNNIQKYVALMVNAEDDDALHNFQECLRVLFRQASECRASGMKMEIEDGEEDLT